MPTEKPRAGKPVTRAAERASTPKPKPQQQGPAITRHHTNTIGEGKPVVRAPLTPVPEASKGRRAGLMVRATRLGYYNEKRRRVGDVFRIRNEQAFSDIWMEWADRNEREHTTPMPEALKQTQDEIRAGRRPASSADEDFDDAEPAPVDNDDPLGDS